MASKKSAKSRKPKKAKRSVDSYLTAAKSLSQYVPRLKKYKNRKTLKPSEKSAIARRERQLKGVENLFPVSKKSARYIKKELFLPGVRAVRMRGLDPATTKLRIHKNGDITPISSDEYKWLYWNLDREQVRSKRELKKTGRAAFAKQFPIEITVDLAREAFKRLDVQGVSLWTHGGRSDAVFDDFEAFELWVNEKWSAGRYMRLDDYGNLKDASDPGKWVSGIAVLLETPEYTARRKALRMGVPK